jgi:glyoxylase-like metal-dependent hydrolase (beta-lactamase superfamily II)
MHHDWYDVEEILPDVFRINDGDLDTSYVLRGSQRTGVIDTGLGIGDLASIVAKLHTAPPLVINTHAHPDHWQGNHQFAETSMSQEEWRMVQSWAETMAKGPKSNQKERSVLDLLRPKRPFPPNFKPAEYQPFRIVQPTHLWADGDRIDLGGLQLEVILAPAHTRGSICLLERKRRLLFTGDTVLYGTIWLHLQDSASPDEAFSTYERLATYAPLVDYVLPAHGTRVLPGEFLAQLNANARRVKAGEVSPRFTRTFAGNGWYYDFGSYGMLFAQKILA